jgi:hydrogenase expression/formation protein HypE
MHDATEGGFVAALNELAEASGVGFSVEWEKLALSREVLTLQNNFKLSDEQVLSLSSTGTVLAAVDSGSKEKVKETLRQNGVSAYFIGEFTDKGRVMIKHKEETPFPEEPIDPYSLIISGK